MLMIAMSIVSGCGRKLGPVASSAQELDRAPRSAVLVRARGLRDADVSRLAEFQNLETLNLAAGTAASPQRLTHAGFRTLAQLQLPALTAVTVSCSDTIDDEAVRAIASLKSLRLVSLVRCKPFTVEGVRALSALQGLEELDLRGCAQLTDECVPLLSRLKSLKAPRALGVTGTGLSAEGVRKLQDALGESVVDVSQPYWKAEDPAASGVASDD
ncbi:MAG TPA: hypothetical protein VFS92_05020 [Planctomycetota bacterium]|nr:hypothetical protein [Planctomycetota bacterium]